MLGRCSSTFENAMKDTQSLKGGFWLGEAFSLFAVAVIVGFGLLIEGLILLCIINSKLTKENKMKREDSG